jgi:DNA-binding CsgD family transcriptional regulator/PAS domain-containing protein
VRASSDSSDFLDLVYDAAIEPGLWTSVITRLAGMVGGSGGFLLEQNQSSGKGDGIIVGADPAVRDDYFGRFATNNVLQKVNNPRAFMKQWTPRILTDEDWLPKEALLRSEFYNEFLRRIEVHSVMMVRLEARGLNAVNLDIGRPRHRGPYEAADIARVGRYHLHLIRSFKLGRRLGASRQVDAGAAAYLEGSPHAVFLVGDDGQVRHLNGAAERLVAAARGLTLLRGALGAVIPDDSRRLQGLIGAAISPDPEQRTGGSMPIASADRLLPLSVLVAPVRSDRLALFDGGPSAIVCVTDLAAGVSLPQTQLREVLGLSPAEARVAMALVEGRTPREAAKSLGLSFFTVRAHLVRIFDKTGTNRQAELVRLIMRLIGVGLQ